MKTHLLFFFAAIGLLPTITSAQEKPPQADESLFTVAEKSDYQATSRYDDVMAFCRGLAERSELVELGEFGESVEGRSLPLLTLADPPVSSPEEARKSDRIVVLAIGNIHAGEVCGKEALLMLSRDLAFSTDREMWKKLVLLVAPIYNADGNERISTENRSRQVGPEQGVGIRANAQGLDLNRDFVKLESPESRALVRLINRWDPALFIDCHTTNGTRHRYTLTFDGPRHPATHPAVIELARDELLPDVRQRLEKETGYKSFFYGNFDQPRERWTTYPALPRYGIQYVGLRQRLAILSEAYAYAPFRDRVLATREFVRQCLLCGAERRDTIADVLQKARATRQPDGADLGDEEVAIRSQPSNLRQVTILAYDKPADGDADLAPRDYEVKYFGLEEPTERVSKPYAYFLPRDQREAVDNLLRHGVKVDELREDLDLDVQVYGVHGLRKHENSNRNYRQLELDLQRREETRRIPAGTWVVRTDQPLASLIVMLLEPHSPDGLAVWKFWGDALASGRDYPVLRLPGHEPLLTASAVLREDKPEQRKPITFETLYGSGRPRFSGSPISGFRWLDDQSYLVSKGGQFCQVDAATGKSTKFFESEAMVAALEGLDEIESEDAKRLASKARSRMDPERTAALMRHDDDLYYATLDGKTAVRLTTMPGAEELATFSPDGRRVAFVRGFDVYVVDVATQSERRLTEGGTEVLRNGKADWVYFEEIYGRSWKAFKWSPDSRSIAFQQFDDSRVASFAVINHVKVQQDVESERYPLAGQTNPLVRLGVVRVAGGGVQWVETEKYTPDNLLISHFVWAQDSQGLYFYVQDRTQRWLDFNLAQISDGSAKTLFREETDAWVDNPGDPHFLKDASFLLRSERDGWQHLYHYSQDGQLIQRLTEGPWEARRVHAVDETEGWVYFSGTRESSMAQNLYRVNLSGTDLRRLTDGDGTHSVSASPGGKFFVDSHSSCRQPTQVHLFHGDGKLSRVLDTNPVPDLEKYTFGEFSLHKIKTRDGSELEASLVKPPNFDPKKKHPVWLMTYGGPHAPSLSNSWRGGRTFEQLLAHMGIIAFRCDPRSASGKGACSTWTAYQQLGVPELRDLEDALDWLAEKPYVDAARIGMSGHSYGGFLTAFAMTHCDRFAAGVSGAPVTDWRNYDTIYTERYMGTPQDNPEGYEATSVVAAAKNLHGRLLLIHGARDDNVHLANTLQLTHALQQADKTFELMIYPPNRHGIHGKHYQRLMVDFIKRTVGSSISE